jgi:hypothetical protein
MVDSAANFPIIFQQAGAVSRVQENVQRGPEAQQMAATEEAAREAKERQKSVQKPDRSVADNKVRTDARGSRERDMPKQKRRRRSKQEDEPEQKEQSLSDEGGLVDVVV